MAVEYASYSLSPVADSPVRRLSTMLTTRNRSRRIFVQSSLSPLPFLSSRPFHAPRTDTLAKLTTQRNDYRPSSTLLPSAPFPCFRLPSYTSATPASSSPPLTASPATCERTTYCPRNHAAYFETRARTTSQWPPSLAQPALSPPSPSRPPRDQTARKWWSSCQQRGGERPWGLGSSTKHLRAVRSRQQGSRWSRAGASA